MKAKESWGRRRWIVASAIVLSAVGEAAATELNGLSQAQREVLVELESRWWGWRREPAPIVPAPKSWKLLKEQWPISTQQEVVVLTGAEPSEQEAYIAEMLRRELSGRYHIPCRVVTRFEPARVADVERRLLALSTMVLLLLVRHEVPSTLTNAPVC